MRRVTPFVVNDTWPIWLESPHFTHAWKPLLASCIVHALLSLTVLVGAYKTGELEYHEPPHQVTRLFTPRSALARSEQQPVSAMHSVPKDIKLVADDPNPVSRDSSVDMNVIELSFKDDVGNQLPAVVQNFGGVFALTDKSDPAFTSYVVEPPEWKVRKVTQDTSGRVRLSVSPPEKWAVLREAARASSIELKDYEVCALFGESFNNCLKQAIAEDVANRFPDRASDRVRAATLAFASGKACGVEVTAVSFEALRTP